MADINNVERTYANKDHYDFEGGEVEEYTTRDNMHGKWTKENFNEFHTNNPEIYNLFVKFTNMATQRKQYYSAKAVFHRIRWESMVTGEGDYKIDDGWISHYARKFMDDFPQHSGFFKTKVRHNSYHSE